MITKKFTNTTYKTFIINWNIFNNDSLSVKTIRIPPKALNMDVSFGSDKDFENCKKQNELHFINGDILVGSTAEKEAVGTNEKNAKAKLNEATEKIDVEVKAIEEQAKSATKSKNSTTKIEVTTEEVGE